jgi:hypothetical protein
MATKKNPVIDEELDEELEDENVGELFQASLTSAVPVKKAKYEGPRVTIFLPKLEDSGDEGVKVDQYEHVTLANEKGEEVYYVLRGEYVEVPVPVFIALKERYPKL